MRKPFRQTARQNAKVPVGLCKIVFERGDLLDVVAGPLWDCVEQQRVGELHLVTE